MPTSWQALSVGCLSTKRSPGANQGGLSQRISPAVVRAAKTTGSSTDPVCGMMSFVSDGLVEGVFRGQASDTDLKLQSLGPPKASKGRQVTFPTEDAGEHSGMEPSAITAFRVGSCRVGAAVFVTQGMTTSR
jgi:hypothetical protein